MENDNFKICWHALFMNCDQCQQKMTVCEVLASANARLQMTYVCSTCKRQGTWKVTIEDLIMICLEADSEEYAKHFQRKLSPPLNQGLTLTEEDKKFLHDMHLDPENGKGDPTDSGDGK